MKASWIGVSSQILLLSQISTAQAAKPAILSSWDFAPAKNQLEITLTAATIPQYLVLPQPPRIVIDLPNTQLGKVAKSANLSGTIRSIQLVQLKGNIVEIILEVAPNTNLSPDRVHLLLPAASEGNRWLLRADIAPKNSPQKPPKSQNPTTVPIPVIPVIEFGQPISQSSKPRCCFA
ncbi:AMIN domain-containing protein [Merismopedia glauca]|uniref:AMIN domain-containing protein n=1 Tax=Merismopedia glauca CCAP 1448/3 TaxID=1296344 RepID=A0A2T1BX65_9CYAN|nr:AMIN domain-containing protein [Merismopedia glauca]PSB00600.1 hypothetical protein C7B64_22670 [Merismopedia glauca CCAP 1448/3]